MATEPETILQKHIELRPNRDGQMRAWIAGTRIRIEDIYVQADLRGKSPDEIVAVFPHLTLGQVHAALAYFFDNRESLLEEMQQDEEFARAMEAKQGPTRFSRLRDQFLKDKDANDDSLSS